MRTLACTLVGILLVVSCVNRPGWPERDGARCLARQGYDPHTITRIVRGEPLGEELEIRLERIQDENVGFLLARNPALAADRKRRLVEHDSDFVRAGLARNPSLEPDLVTRLRRDESHTVWVGLAANPGLDAATLLAIKDDTGIEWSWFAMNPACPPEVESRIQASKDEKANYWLERTRESLRGWPIERPMTGQD